MPWDNNGNGGGPWGQEPGGGNGGGRGPKRPSNNNTPDLEEILKRGRDRFRGELPGGRWLFLGGAAALAVLWLVQSVYTVAPEEIGVELLFGQPKTELSESGLHFVFWPFETVEKVTITENQTRIASVTTGRSRRDEGFMLTGDQNIVDLSMSVLWRVNDPAKYLFNIEDPDEIVRKIAESAMREVVGRRQAQEIFRDDKAGIFLEVQNITQGILDFYEAGVAVTKISIEEVKPPPEVADAFDEVQRAEQDEDRFQEEARQYSNTLLGGARGQAAQVREAAAAYKDRVVKEAEGEAARFVSIYEEYAKAPDVTRKRLFLETMEQVLGSSDKVIIEGDAGTGVVPYLPLPELRNNSNRTGG